MALEDLMDCQGEGTVRSVHTTEENLDKVSRRSLLRWGLVGGGLLLVGGGGWLALRKGDLTALPPQGLQALLPSTYPILVVVAETIIPPDLVTPEEVALAIDRRLSFALPALQEEFNLGLALLENGFTGLFTRGSGTPFSSLGPVERAKGLLAWRDSPIGLLNNAYHGIRKLCMGAYYAEAAANRRSGYPGPLFEKPDPGPLSERAPISMAYLPPSHGQAETEQ
jgi:hypothetical protein